MALKLKEGLFDTLYDGMRLRWVPPRRDELLAADNVVRKALFSIAGLLDEDGNTEEARGQMIRLKLTVGLIWDEVEDDDYNTLFVNLVVVQCWGSIFRVSFSAKSR